MFMLKVKRKLANLTDTCVTSGYKARLADNSIASPPTGKVISAGTSGRTGYNISTNNDTNKDQRSPTAFVQKTLLFHLL